MSYSRPANRKQLEFHPPYCPALGYPNWAFPMPSIPLAQAGQHLAVPQSPEVGKSTFECAMAEDIANGRRVGILAQKNTAYECRMRWHVPLTEISTPLRRAQNRNLAKIAAVLRVADRHSHTQKNVPKRWPRHDLLEVSVSYTGHLLLWCDKSSGSVVRLLCERTPRELMILPKTKVYER